jgi:hypothetical protein
MRLPVYESAARSGAVVPEITNIQKKSTHKTEKTTKNTGSQPWV